MVYLDNAATTAPYDFNPLGCIYGNASSQHSKGREAAKALEEARAKIAKCINAEPEEIFFTSGGTESNNMALSLFKDDIEVIRNNMEHPSIINFRGWTRVANNDFSNLEYLIDLRSNFIVTNMLVNNELGIINDIKSLARQVHAMGGIMHTDAVQALGHIRVDVKDLEVDLLSGSSHKFHGPKGVGFLYISKRIQPEICGQLMYGGHQEKGLRPGTYNTLGICQMAYALEKTLETLDEDQQKWKKYNNMIKKFFEDNIHKVEYNGQNAKRVFNIMNISFDGVRGEELQGLLDTNGICVSTGSACSSDTNEPSPTLLAYGLNAKQANSSIRISFSKFTTENDINRFCLTLKDCLALLRGE